jgi:hypothetical protein
VRFYIINEPFLTEEVTVRFYIIYEPFLTEEVPVRFHKFLYFDNITVKIIIIKIIIYN